MWKFGEELWADAAAKPWVPDVVTPVVESMSEILLARLLSYTPEGSVVRTLGEARPNRVVAVSPDAMWVETDKTRAQGTGAQPVPGWMLQLAYDSLRSTGTLTNAALLTDLRVHRSSFVCAALARLPEVEVVSKRPITLSWRGDEVAV